MQHNNEELVEVLNDLIRINNDRIEGYEKAMNETKDIDADLRTLFRRMADQSRQNKAELVQEVQKRGGGADTKSTTNAGKIYRAWMGVKATFSGKDRKSVLAACEYGEDAAQKAYQQATESEATMDADVRQLITKEKASLKESHDLIKRHRDMQTTKTTK
ncbi:PA2169 family four-helix-bundle protein [Pseudoflavitalea sp. X16]|uniref:ferritin-like domain-containing protein n=1 Tax=Paraflavitalea devenefica TaxID=2716334 RepID=UPI001420C737|nr:PA2169 family four-helix-bundle protein [Paraflavitalea devenefica]NII25883.1 PA2169 family four-helix-bundle protein [Paraflavitalea devenefica]